MSPTHQVIIIGAGFGGMALAIRLQSHGIATMVFDEIDAGIGGATAHAVGPMKVSSPAAETPAFPRLIRRSPS